MATQRWIIFIRPVLVLSRVSQTFQLAKLQVEQEERTEELSDETLSLIGQYNAIVETISQSFLHYDKIISAEEEKLAPKQKWFQISNLLWSFFKLCSVKGC